MRNDNLSPIDDPHAGLEQRFIDEFLGSVGCAPRSAGGLGTLDVATLLRAASQYASLRLAEIESRAHYTDEIHRSS